MRITATDDKSMAEDEANAATFGNRYYIPLDLELLEIHLPFFQTGPWDKLQYQLTFNDYNRVVLATGDYNKSYKIDNICLEFDMATLLELTCTTSNQSRDLL